MTQLDDLQDYVNFELPRRKILLRSDDPDVAYDNDPNLPGAPAILQSAPTGYEYERKGNNSFYQKEPSGFWRSKLPFADRVTYIDSTSGDDANDGSESNPIQTLQEAGRRQFSFGLNEFILEDGDYRLPDILTQQGGDFTTNERLLFASSKGVTIRGRNRATQQAITITGWSTNAAGLSVATVSETLTPDAHIGQALYAEPFGPTFPLAWHVLTNDASTITLMLSNPGLGGFFDPSGVTGAQVLYKPAVRILPPVTNDNSFVNRMYLDGVVVVKDIEFFGVSDATGPTIRGGATRFERCWFTGWDRGASVEGGSIETTNCYFDGQGNSNVAGIEVNGGKALPNQDTVFVNTTTGIAAQPGGLINTASFNVLWGPGCFLFASLRGADFADFAYRYYTESGPYGTEGFVRIDSPGNYYRPNTPWTQVGTYGMLTAFDVQTGGCAIDLRDSASASFAGTNYINIDGVGGISLADYNAGNPPAQGVRSFADLSKGVFVFD